MKFKRYVVLSYDDEIEYKDSFSSVDEFIDYLKGITNNRSYSFVRYSLREKGFYTFEGKTVFDSEHSTSIIFIQGVRKIIRDKRLKKLLELDYIYPMEFEPGDRVINDKGVRGTIIDRKEYYKENGSLISTFSECVLYDKAYSLMVTPREKLRYDIQWYREKRLKDFLE